MSTVDYKKELFQPLLLLHLSLEEEHYHNDLVPWPQRRERLRLQYEELAHKHWQRLERAGALLQGLTLSGAAADDIRRIYGVGVLRYDQGDYEGSGDLFFLLIHLAPQNSNCWTLLGMSEQRQGHYEEAMQAYQQAILLGAPHYYPDLYSAQCLLHLGRYGEAKEQVERLLADKALQEAKPALQQALLAMQRQLMEEHSHELYR